MFESAASLSSRRLTAVAYYTRLALEHRFTPEDLRRYPLLAGSSSEPSPEDQDLACRWLAEIQVREGRPIDQLSSQTLRWYAGEISEMALRRSDAERPDSDPERTQRLLEELRRAVPWPPLDLRRAG